MFLRELNQSINFCQMNVPIIQGQNQQPPITFNLTPAAVATSGNNWPQQMQQPQQYVALNQIPLAIQLQQLAVSFTQIF
jgi:hypothetical protein